MRIPIRIPERLERALSNPVRAAECGDWLDRLPDLLYRSVTRFDLREILPPMKEPYAEMSFNYITPVVRSDGASAVLKLCPGEGGFVVEREGLRLCNPAGSVGLLDEDEGLGALLLERADPGIPLSERDDDEANTRIAAGVMLNYWRPVTDAHRLTSVEEWTLGGMRRHRERSEGGSGALPAALFDEAERTFERLIAEGRPRMVLHGDMHHYNILSAGNGWVSIDPKGMEGDPGYDLGAYMGNCPAGSPGSEPFRRQMERRVELFADTLGMDFDRVAAWCWAHAVLVATWCDAEGDAWRGTIERAEVIRALM